MPLLKMRFGLLLALAFTQIISPFLTSEGLAHEREVSIGILSYPPFSYEDEQGRLIGASVEHIREAFKAVGYQSEIELLPYARCISLVEHGDIDVCGIVNRSTSKKLITAETAIISASHTFFVRSDDPWTYEGIESLEDRRVLTVAGYNYRSMNARYQDFLEGDNEITIMPASRDYLVRIAHMISSDRADVFNEATDAMNFALRQAGLEGTLRPAGNLSVPGEMLPGFAPGPRGETLKKAFDRGWQKIIQSGKLLEIQNKYQLVVSD